MLDMGHGLLQWWSPWWPSGRNLKRISASAVQVKVVLCSTGARYVATPRIDKSHGNDHGCAVEAWQEAWFLGQHLRRF